MHSTDLGLLEEPSERFDGLEPHVREALAARGIDPDRSLQAFLTAIRTGKTGRLSGLLLRKD